MHLTQHNAVGKKCFLLQVRTGRRRKPWLALFGCLLVWNFRKFASLVYRKLESLFPNCIWVRSVLSGLTSVFPSAPCGVFKSHDSSVGIALGYGLDDRDSRVPFLARAGNFSLYHRVQNGSGAHPASCPMGTRGSFPGGKAGREADRSPPSSTEVKEWVELYLHSPNTPRWRGAQLKHRDNFTFFNHVISLYLLILSAS
jgi:hypothetical protein